MEHLTKLTPAETLLLLEGENAQLRDLLKVTVMDLFAKQVIQTKNISPDIKNKESVSNLVVQGDNFHLYHPFEHEEVFLRPLKVGSNAQIHFNDFIKAAYKKAKNENHYSNLVLRNKTLEPYFERGLSKIFNGKFSLTSAGKQVVQKVKNEMRELQAALTDAIENDRPEVLEIMKKVKGNFFLVKNIDSKMMKEIESHLLNTKNADIRNLTTSSPDMWMWLTLDMSFDNSWNDSGWDGGDGVFD